MERCPAAGIGEAGVAKTGDQHLRLHKNSQFEKYTLWVRMHIVAGHPVMRPEVIDADGALDIGNPNRQRTPGSTGNHSGSTRTLPTAAR
jgi:hypothetical protein